MPKSKIKHAPNGGYPQEIAAEEHPLRVRVRELEAELSGIRRRAERDARINTAYQEACTSLVRLLAALDSGNAG